jgi:hypothetical protein
MMYRIVFKMMTTRRRMTSIATTTATALFMILLLLKLSCNNNHCCEALPTPSTGSSSSSSFTKSQQQQNQQQRQYGRISDNEYRLTPSQIESFHRDGCITLDKVLTEEEVTQLTKVFDKFINGEIHVPGKDFCDMSKPFGIPYEEWSLVNCMLPTKYYPPLQKNNIFESLTQSIADQLFPTSQMVKDYDQLLNKRPGKTDAIFAYHQDMAYWPSKTVLKVDRTDTCTFSLALDDSTEENGCLRYVLGSGSSKTVRPHRPATGSTRDEGHALTTDVYENEIVRLAPATKGSMTIHDEYVVHGSGGNHAKDKQRRTVRTSPSFVLFCFVLFCFVCL